MRPRVTSALVKLKGRVFRNVFQYARYFQVSIVVDAYSLINRILVTKQLTCCGFGKHNRGGIIQNRCRIPLSLTGTETSPEMLHSRDGLVSSIAGRQP